MAGRRKAFAALAAALAVGALAVVFLQREKPAGNEQAEKPPPPPAAKEPQPAPHVNPRPIAVVLIAPSGGSAAQGSVRFIGRKEGGVSIDYRLENLPPGKHVLAIHDTGDCAAVSEAPTIGEVGQVVANVMGRTRGRLGHEGMTLGEGPVDVLGRALVIHKGNAKGKIVGCGVLERQ